MPLLTMKDGRTYLIGQEVLELVEQERRYKARLRDLTQKAKQLKQTKEAACPSPTPRS